MTSKANGTVADLREGSPLHGAADEQDERSTRARGFAMIAQGFALLAAAERVDPAPVHATIITVDNVATEFPGLTSRCFSDAGRRGEFPAFRSGRKLAAKRADVEAWLASRRFEPRPRKAKPAKIDPELEYEQLARRGVQ